MMEERDDTEDNDLIRLGLSSAEAGMVLSAMGLANCCGRIGFGQALDWWKDKASAVLCLFPSSFVFYDKSVFFCFAKSSYNGIVRPFQIFTWLSHNTQDHF